MTFDHRDDGTSEATWQREPRLAALAPLALRGVVHLVVLAAHPDDESLGAGGLIAAAAATGVGVDVVVATFGEASHPRSPTHTPARLAAIRRGEVCTAVRRLAPSARLHLLGLPDGALAASARAMADALDPLVHDGAAGSTWLVAPWRRDGHPDHEAAGRAAATVADRRRARLLEHPVWAWHWADPAIELFAAAAPWSDLRAFALDAAARAAKRHALAAHASQVEPLSPAVGDEPVVAAGFAAHFERDVEVFIEGSRESSREDQAP